MKHFVRLSAFWQGAFFGLGGLLLAGIVQQESTVSYLVVVSLAALSARAEWLRRRRGKKKLP